MPNQSQNRCVSLINFCDYCFFGYDTAEDETPEVLNSYFVNKYEFKKFNSSKFPFAIVNARKGLGKSALLCHVHYFKKGNPNYLSIHLTAKDFYFNENDLKNGQTNNFEHLWQEKICDRIISEIGKEIKFAYTINDITIVKHSEDKGFKQQNPVGFLIGHVKFFGKFFRINLKPQKQVNTIQLVKQYLKTNKKKKIWIFIDDIGACQASCRLLLYLCSNFSAQSPHDLRRVIGGPFSAMSKLC